MKINLHSHTYFSDGKDSPSVMMLESQKIGLSTYVVTDHFSPANPNGTSHSLGVQSFASQRQELKNMRRYLNYDYIQGIELNLGYEEVLLFGLETIRELFSYCYKHFNNESYLALSEYISIIEFLKERKNQCAIVLCHPRLDLHNPLTKSFYYSLLPILDGYEHYNHGHNWFEGRNVPLSLLDLKDFDNSDAHWYKGLTAGNGNEHTKPIRNEAELIKFIKGRRN